jgi:hypothetical protein
MGRPGISAMLAHDNAGVPKWLVSVREWQELHKQDWFLYPHPSKALP